MGRIRAVFGGLAGRGRRATVVVAVLEVAEEVAEEVGDDWGRGLCCPIVVCCPGFVCFGQKIGCDLHNWGISSNFAAADRQQKPGQGKRAGSGHN